MLFRSGCHGIPQGSVQSPLVRPAALESRRASFSGKRDSQAWRLRGARGCWAQVVACQVVACQCRGTCEVQRIVWCGGFPCETGFRRGGLSCDYSVTEVGLNLIASGGGTGAFQFFDFLLCCNVDGRARDKQTQVKARYGRGDTIARGGMKRGGKKTASLNRNVP